LPQKLKKERVGKMDISATLSKTRKPASTYPVEPPQAAIILQKISRKTKRYIAKPGLDLAFRKNRHNSTTIDEKACAPL
jgi:hypothetical protein